MRIIQLVVINMTLLTVSLISAYDSWAQPWHDDMVPANSFVNFGKTWYNNEPDDLQAQIKAQREKEEREKRAQRRYQDQQERIQRKKENRRSVTY